MEKCLIIINDAAGGNRKISFDKVEKCLGNGFLYERKHMSDEPKIDGFDAVAVCGGDGTLGSVLGKTYDKDVKVFYFPSGTLNDKAKADRYEHAKLNAHRSDEDCGEHAVVGIVESDDEKKLFAYVFAAGAFTPIGYTVPTETKKKLGVLAYLSKVVKEYKIHRIKAAICVDGENTFDGEFALIMFLKSRRCFGFSFNKDFDGESESGHLITIRSPKRDGLLGKIEMFFPFFRTFFLGLKKERNGKIIFKKIKNATVESDEIITYCRDGERQETPKKFTVDFEKTKCEFTVVSKF